MNVKLKGFINNNRIFIFISMSQDQEGLENKSHIRLIEEKNTKLYETQREPVFWETTYLNGKYEIAHPLSIDQLHKSDHPETPLNPHHSDQKQQQKATLIFSSNNPNNEIPKQQQSNKTHKIHLRPDSALSRQCKTELNEIKVLKAKRDSERKLMEEEEKYKAKFEQLREVLIKKEKKNEFVIKDVRKSSHKNESVRQSEKKGNKSINGEKYQNFTSFHPKEIKPVQKTEKTQKVNEKSNKADLSANNSNNNNNKSISNNNRYHNMNEHNNRSSANNSKNNKSFVISQRKSLVQSKDANANRSSSSLTSKIQLQKLNSKIKMMQDKLHVIQRRQEDLEKIQMSRIQQFEEYKESRVREQEGERERERQTLQHLHEERRSDKKNINKQDTEEPKHKTNKPESQKKVYIIQPSQKIAQINSQKNHQNLHNSNNQQNEDKNNQSFNIAFAKKKDLNLNMSSSIYNYNYSEDQEREKEKYQKENEKKIMAEEIGELKKTIRELKLERIKHEAIIEDFEKNSKVEERILKEKLKESRDIVEKSRKNTEQNKIQSNHGRPTNHKKTEQTEQKKYNKGAYQTEISKNIPRKALRIDTQNEESRKSRIQTSQNPEQSGIRTKGKEFHPRSLSKRGIIVRQIVNQSFSQSIQDHKVATKQSLEKQNGLEDNPLSPTSTGRKIFQLEFVQAEKEDSVVSEDPDFVVPQIDVQGFPIPEIPGTPLSDITQADLLKLAKEVCNTFEIKIQKDEHLYMKKYKNCIIFKTPDPRKTIVWHYSGKFYIGGWEQNEQGQGKKNGEGFEYIPEKHYYKGQFYQGKKNGTGIMIQDNGNIYHGQWEKGEKHGQGKYLEKNAGICYEGEWKNGKKDGKGVQKVSENEFYDGTFVKSIKHGFGSQTFSNGDKYHGEYKFGRFHGKGKYMWANGSSYDGDFLEGHREGRGRWKSCKKGGDVYQGEYKKDKKVGEGKYTWANGCIYNGQFLNDLKHGEGRVSYPDGREIKGYWEDGKLAQIVAQSNPDLDQSSVSSYKISNKKVIVTETPSKKIQSSAEMLVL